MAKKKKGTDKIRQPIFITDGRLHAPEVANSEYSSLDQLFNDRVSLSVFKDGTVEAFEGRLSEMNLADMQSLASRAGLLPIYDREVLKQRLVTAYKTQQKKMNPAVVPQLEHTSDDTANWRAAMQDINKRK